MNHLLTEMAKIESINNTREFVRLRKLTVSRLLILNCRHGSEPTRVTVDDLGGPNSWIGTASLSPSEKEMLKKYSVTYLIGKGVGLVTILLTSECTRPCKLLANIKFQHTAATLRTCIICEAK